MKCVQIGFFIYVLCVVNSEDSSVSNPSKAIIVRNINTLSDDVHDLSENMKLSEARIKINLPTTYTFHRHYLENTPAGNVERNAPISISKENLFTIQQIIYKNDIIYIGYLDRNIELINIDEKMPAHYLEINDTILNSKLDEVRRIWTAQGIRIDDKFFWKKDGKFAAIPNENQYLLKDIRVNGKVYHGFEQGDISRFLKGLKMSRDGEMLMTNYKVANFKKYPRIVSIDRADYKSRFTSDERAVKMLQSGIDEQSASLGFSFLEILSFNVEIKSSQSFEQSSSSSSYKSFSYVSYVIVKQEIEMDAADLVINSDAYEEIQNALTQRRFPLENALALLQFLQKYGWYVPLQYKVGGCAYDTKTSYVRSSQEAAKECETFSASFKASGSYKGIGADAGSSGSTQRENSNSTDTKSERRSGVLSTRGGDGTAATIETFGSTLSNPTQWQVIEYKRFLPTLMLLKDYNNWTLSKCLQLLSDYHSQLRTREDNVDIQKYVLGIQRELY